MRILPTAILVFFAVSSATSSSSDPTTSRLRGSGNTSRIRGAAIKQHNNIERDEGRLLQDTEAEDDPNKRSGKNTSLRDPADKKATKNSVLITAEARVDNTDDLSSRSRNRKAPHSGGNLRSRDDKRTKNPKNVLPTTKAAQEEESNQPSEEPIFVDGAIFVSDSPTPRPTAFPTWTFEVAPAPQIVEEANAVCEYCQQGCYISTNTVSFKDGATITCSKIMELAPSLTPLHCSFDRDIIEDACCCKPSSAVPESTSSRIDLPAADTGACDNLCTGKEFLNDPIISFSSGDSVSCRGVKDMLQFGLTS